MRLQRNCLSHVLPAILAVSCTPSASANNFGESTAWQFMTPAERAARLAQLDLIEKRRGGYYAAPIYNTRIDRQYNCSISAAATGNVGSQSALANSPTVTGATASATGNENVSSADAAAAALASSQTNTGAVMAGVVGSTETEIHGAAWQALNSQQTNSGDQQASVERSQACAFGALNG